MAHVSNALAVYVISSDSFFGPLFVILTFVGAVFVHTHVLTTHTLHDPFASVTFKLTVYCPGSSNFFLYVLLFHAAVHVFTNCVHAHVLHSYSTYVKFPHHASLPLNVYVISLLSVFGPLLLIFPTGASFIHFAVAVAQLLPLHWASNAL